MKKEGMIVVLVSLVLLVSAISSISIVSAESNETEANETEANETESEECPTIKGWRISDNLCISDSGCDYDSSSYTYYDSEEECASQLEPETETCAASISISFNQNVYYEGDFYEITVEVFDSSGNNLPNYAFYTTMYDNMWHTPDLQETGSGGYHKRSGTIDRQNSGITNFKFKAYTQETGSCSSVEGTAEIEIIYEETEEKEEYSEPAPTICAAKIEINFDEPGYAPGDTFSLEVGVFDSQGNGIPNYPFYVRMYDNMWHSAEFKTTGSDGYFRESGEVPEKTIQDVTKGIFHAYTQEISSCGVVEDKTEIFLENGEVEEAEPVPCGIGTCIPEEEEEPEEIPKDEIFYNCNGCKLEGRCYPIGYRKEGGYCSDNYEFIDQSKAGTCDNHFECKSNVCVSGECVGESLIKRIIKWFKKLFGGGDEEPEEPDDKICRKLLIEKDIEDYEYFTTEYGKRKEQQIGLFSEDGEQIGIVKCCVAGYKLPDGTEGIAGIVCPFDNEKDVENSLQGLVNNGDLVLGEYKGQKIYRRLDKPEETPEVVAWISNTYFVASGRGPGEGKISEEVADVYLKKYPNDL